MNTDHPLELSRAARRPRLDTLVRIRWLAIAGQSLAVLGVLFGLGFPLPLAACFTAIAASGVLNIVLGLRYPANYRLSDGAATAFLAFDILQLALLLYLTGGLQNPFSTLFLAPVLISATALTPRRTLALGALAIGCAATLIVFHRPLPWARGGLDLPGLYVAGIFTAILLGIVFTAIYARRVAEEARQLAEALAATELVLAREQHLTQLDGLAAAAAHELGTPLATIALVAKELEHAAASGPMLDDIRLLREQVGRCRDILSKLTSMGQDQPSFFETITLGHLLEEIVEPHRPLGAPIRIDSAGEGEEPLCRHNPGLIYGLANILDNAVDFAGQEVTITARWDAAKISIAIGDDGPGFAPEVLLRGGDPYVTTRGRDKGAYGSGLGLFIAKTLIERTSAQLSIANKAPPLSGALVRIVWQRDAFGRGINAERL